MFHIPKLSKRYQYIPRMLSHLERRTASCLTYFQVFWSRKQWRCWKFQTRSITSNSVSRSAMLWLRDLWALSSSMFDSPRKIWSMPFKNCSDSLKYGRCSSIEGGRYTPKIGVGVCPMTTLQITTFVPCKSVDSILHLSVHPLSPVQHRPGPPLLLDGCAAEKFTSYPSRL